MTLDEKQQILELKARGMTSRDIGEKTGYFFTGVARFCAKPESVDRIKELQRRFYEDNAPVAVENFRKFLTSESDDKQDKYIKYRASKDVLDGVGITGVTPSVYVQQIIGQQQVVLPPMVKDIIEKHLSGLLGSGNGGEVVDAEVGEVESVGGKE